MVKTVSLKNYSDVHFTEKSIARNIVNHFAPKGVCLEPFRGGGSFFDAMPIGSVWCEISDGVDFFNFKDRVDWIITNPPFSNLTAVFEHAFRISDHCVFLVPISKYWSSQPRLKLVRQYGGLKEILHVGTGRQIGFDIGFPFAAMYFASKYNGPINENFLHLSVQYHHETGSERNA